MGVGRAQELHVQQAVDRDVEGVARLAGHHGGTGRRRDIAAARRGRIGLVDVAHAAHRVLDGAISGAPAQIALEGVGEVGALGLVEARGRDDHAGRAKSALETLGLQKGALHRMERAAARETFDGRDLAAFGAERRDEAAVHGLAVDRARCRRRSRRRRSPSSRRTIRVAAGRCAGTGPGAASRRNRCR